LLPEQKIDDNQLVNVREFCATLENSPAGVTLLKPHYSKILQSMPKNYQPTIYKLLDCFNDDQVCAILNSANSNIANKMILDGLIMKINATENLLDFCYQLELIDHASDLKQIAIRIRAGQIHMKCM